MRMDAFNILAKYKEDEQNYIWVVQSNDGMTFTTFDDNNNNNNTINDAVATLTDELMTSDLTTSTNPQQHGSTHVNNGGSHGQGHNGWGSGGHGHNDRCTITCF